MSNTTYTYICYLSNYTKEGRKVSVLNPQRKILTCFKYEYYRIPQPIGLRYSQDGLHHIGFDWQEYI